MRNDRVKALFDQAMDKKRGGEFVAAQAILVPLVAERPDNAKLRAALGDAFWKGEDLINAIEQFKFAVNLNPSWELISRSLFHCLWDAGKREEAMAEMSRYLAIADSIEYRKILKAIENRNEEP